MNPQDEMPDGPVVQSVAIGFRVLYAAVAVLAAFWLGSNIRQVPPDAQAVVLCFGRIVAVQQSGLILAWPRPIADVVLLPSADRQVAQPIAPAPISAGVEDFYTKASGESLPPNSSAFLTGDGGVVLLTATVSYRIVDAAAYYLASSHVAPAVQRLFQASAAALAAGRELDDFLVTRAAGGARAASVEASRQAIRGDMMAAMNARLAALARSGDPLGIEISRVDVQAALPPSAKMSFDSVLSAMQMAEQGIAAARTDAARTAQEGDRERDRLLSAASATAAEAVASAETKTATVTALHARMTADTRPGLLDQVYRDELALVVHKVGTITAVDPRGGPHLILPGSRP